MPHSHFRLLILLFVVCLVSCASHREVPTNFPFTFKDNNPHQIAGAKVYGIEPLEDRSCLTKKVKRKLTYIEENKYYAIDPLTHSVPYLTPDAAKLLKDIGKNFQKKLRKHKMGEYKIIVTSVYRRYKYVNGKQADALQLKYLLGEVMQELRAKGRCFVRYETQQTCLHITVSP